MGPDLEQIATEFILVECISVICLEHHVKSPRDSHARKGFKINIEHNDPKYHFLNTILIYNYYYNQHTL